VVVRVSSRRLHRGNSRRHFLENPDNCEEEIPDHCRMKTSTVINGLIHGFIFDDLPDSLRFPAGIAFGFSLMGI
jgi:hypothetical protein